MQHLRASTSSALALMTCEEEVSQHPSGDTADDAALSHREDEAKPRSAPNSAGAPAPLLPQADGENTYGLMLCGICVTSGMPSLALPGSHRSPSGKTSPQPANTQSLSVESPTASTSAPSAASVLSGEDFRGRARRDRRVEPGVGAGHRPAAARVHIPAPHEIIPRLRDKRPAPGVASFTGEGTAVKTSGLDRKALSTASSVCVRVCVRSHEDSFAHRAEQVTRSRRRLQGEGTRHRVQRGIGARCPNRQCRGRGGQGTRNPHRRKATKSLLSPRGNHAVSCFGENGGLIKRETTSIS